MLNLFQHPFRLTARRSRVKILTLNFRVTTRRQRLQEDVVTSEIDPEGNVLYKGQAFHLLETDEFHSWLGSLKDRRAMARIGQT